MSPLKKNSTLLQQLNFSCKLVGGVEVWHHIALVYLIVKHSIIMPSQLPKQLMVDHNAETRGYIIVDWRGETLRDTLSVYFLAVFLDFIPSRSPRHIRYVCLTYLALLHVYVQGVK